MQTNQPLLSATGLNKRYSRQMAVAGVNLDLHKGEVLGLLGPNGAGKSTTMQMLTGNLSPTSGEIRIGDIDLLDYPRQAKQLIGYLPEQPPVYRDMTAFEYLGYCAALRGIPAKKRTSAIEAAMQRCAIGDVSRRLIGNLSKGYQQRVGIAQAILHNPDVIILDEPTVGLDPIQISEIRELIRELGRSHGVILSTHILPEVQQVCDRVQIIHQGKTVFSDTLQALAKGQGESVILLAFEAPAGQVESLRETVEKLAAVSSVEEESAAAGLVRWRITINAAGDRQQCAARIAQRVCEKGLTLYELSFQSRTLEQIFMGLIHGEKPSGSTSRDEEMA